jgi:outer membrane biosynthesis protein TonB
VVKTPPPATLHQPEAEKPVHETASASGAAKPTPGAESGFDDDVPTSPRARQAAGEAKNALSPESTPEDFSQSEKTPLPSQSLPPVEATVPPVRESKNWPIANLSFAHPPAMPDGMSVEGAMALPTPAPLSGPLFANVADLPVKTLVGHAEVGLSKLTGLAALVHKHRHLKYVAAAGVLVVLVIAVILLSWQGENGKGVSKVAEIEKKARAAALAADPVPVPAKESALAVAPSVDPEPSKPHASAAAHASKRVSRPAVPTPTPAPAQNAKAAPVEDPFAPPAGMTRSAEKPIPLAALQGTRASVANEPRPVSQAQISEVVRKKENQAGLKTCYERALKRDGRLRTGRLDITVSIGAMGTVQRVQVNGAADFMVIDKCLKEAIRHWRFPASSEEYATSVPLILQGG